MRPDRVCDIFDVFVCARLDACLLYYEDRSNDVSPYRTRRPTLRVFGTELRTLPDRPLTGCSRARMMGVY